MSFFKYLFSCIFNKFLANWKILVVKKECTYSLAWESHNADCRKSTRRIESFELLYANVLQCAGWNSGDVVTSAIIISRGQGSTNTFKMELSSQKNRKQIIIC